MYECVCVCVCVCQVLAQLCSQFTGLVDMYLPAVTEGVCHHDAVLRYFTVKELTALVSEDFVKFKSHVMYRYPHTHTHRYEVNICTQKVFIFL